MSKEMAPSYRKYQWRILHLNVAINNGVTNDDTNWRIYPNNFIWLGDYNHDGRYNTHYGRFWTATAKDNATAYRAGNRNIEVTVYNKAYNKWDGFSVRCIYYGG